MMAIGEMVAAGVRFRACFFYAPLVLVRFRHRGAAGPRAFVFCFSLLRACERFLHPGSLRLRYRARNANAPQQHVQARRLDTSRRCIGNATDRTTRFRQPAYPASDPPTEHTVEQDISRPRTPGTPTHREAFRYSQHSRHFQSYAEEAPPVSDRITAKHQPASQRSPRDASHRSRPHGRVPRIE
jgi:hypothetical protein